MIANDKYVNALHQLEILFNQRLSTTDANYDITVDMLCKRYNNQKLIIKHHVSEIVDIGN